MQMQVSIFLLAMANGEDGSPMKMFSHADSSRKPDNLLAFIHRSSHVISASSRPVLHSAVR